MQTYTYHNDPGHGWVEVPLTEIKRLGLKISPYSYRWGPMAYLEEDCDYTLWAEAKRAAGEEFAVREIYMNDYSPIREYRSF